MTTDTSALEALRERVLEEVRDWLRHEISDMPPVEGLERHTAASLLKVCERALRPRQELQTHRNIASIPTDSLYGACAAYECAHEPEQVSAARAMLEGWGITFEQGCDELDRRETALLSTGKDTMKEREAN